MIFVLYPVTILRVAFYLRARTLALAAEQAARLQAVAETAPAWRVVAVFCDIDPVPGRSARTGAAHAAADGFDVLLVESLDRLARNTDDGPDLLAVTADGGLVVQPVIALAAGQQPLPVLLGARMAEEG